MHNAFSSQAATRTGTSRGRQGGTSGPAKRVRNILIATASAVALTLALASPAFALTDTYCNGCTIGAHTAIEDIYAFYATLDYVHRLSGPSCSTIGAYGHYTDGTYGSEALATCTDNVSHGFDGTRLLWGGADNQGNGNYGFNAHVDY